jgi:hypothetical protein
MMLSAWAADEPATVIPRAIKATAINLHIFDPPLTHSMTVLFVRLSKISRAMVKRPARARSG